jgi:hypothetical protein
MGEARRRAPSLACHRPRYSILQRVLSRLVVLRPPFRLLLRSRTGVCSFPLPNVRGVHSRRTWTSNGPTRTQGCMAYPSSCFARERRRRDKRHGELAASAGASCHTTWTCMQRSSCTTPNSSGPGPRFEPPGAERPVTSRAPRSARSGTHRQECLKRRESADIDNHPGGGHRTSTTVNFLQIRDVLDARAAGSHPGGRGFESP